MELTGLRWNVLVVGGDDVKTPLCNFCKLTKEIPERPELRRFTCICEEEE